MSEYTKIGISLETKLLERLDKKRGDVPRSKFISRALEEVLSK